MGHAKKKKGDSGTISYFEYNCIRMHQGEAFQLISFVAKASEIHSFADINRRNPDKQEGYQRILKPSRVDSVARYVDAGNPIPNSILLTLDDVCKYVANQIQQQKQRRQKRRSNE